MKNKLFIIYIVIIFILLMLFGISLSVGAEKISFREMISCLFDLEDSDSLKFKRIIVLDLRLPRILLVVITGMLLGGSGAIFQMYFRNSLAEPALLGISSGATLGAVLSITLLPSTFFCTALYNSLFSNGPFYAIGQASFIAHLSAAFPYISPTSTAAFIGALFAGLLMMLLSFTKAGSNNTVLLLLCGSALGSLYSAISSFVLITHTQDLVNTYGWLMGSFNGHGWNELRFILLPAVVSFALMALLTTKLDYLNGGEHSALALGIDVNKTRICVLLCGSLAISACVCAGGTIGFIGLMAPHIVRRLAGPQAKRLIPLSVLCGAILLLISDTVARTIIAPAELPAGIITSILGVPFFLSLILCNRSFR